MKRMMRMKKRTRANLITLALVLVLSLFGTVFAWFMDYETITGRSFGFANVNGSLTTEYTYYDFNDVNQQYDLNYMLALVDFENYLKNTVSSKDSWSAVWEDFWNNQKIETRISNLSTKDDLKWGGVVRKKYTFKNDSSIPVYFRMKAPQANNNLINVAYFINNNDMQENGGYWYRLEPLNRGEEIEVEVIIYIPMRANIDENDNFIIIPFNAIYADVIIKHIEIIQASNNAVYFADGWKEVAEQGLFK